MICLRKSLIIIICLFFCFKADFVLAGFGISPPLIKNIHLTGGSVFEKEIFLVRGDASEEIEIKAEIKADGFSSWIEIENGGEFLLPSGVNKFPMKVVIRVPINAEEKSYSGKIILNTFPKNDSTNKITTRFGAEILIDLEVSQDDFSSFNVDSLTISNFKNSELLGLLIKAKNDGNRFLSFNKVKLKIFNSNFSTHLTSFEKDIIDGVAPFSEKKILINFDTNLENGQYWAEINLYKDGDVIKKENTAFVITEEDEIEKDIYSFDEKMDYDKEKNYLFKSFLVLFVMFLVLFRRHIWKIIKNNKK